MSFISKLRNAQRTNNSLLCIGLDTDPAKIPSFLRAYGNPQLEFNRRIIEATKDLVCAYKLNVAFYEAAGEIGWYSLGQTLLKVPPHIVSIGDAKRGDIGNSSERYAKTYLETYRFDAVTVSPYMGRDSIAPFLGSRDQAVFILALTSNPGAKDFQYLSVDGRPLYEHVVEKSLTWSDQKNIGYVVGATRPEELKAIRDLAPGAPLLIPGVGAQGGSLEDAVQYGTDKNGELAIINASRSIIYASTGEGFAQAARAEAMKLRDAMNAIRAKSM